MKIVLASHNKGKIQEVTDILAPFGIEVEPISEDFPEIEEDGDSFEENAKIKARAVCKASRAFTLLAGQARMSAHMKKISCSLRRC